MMSSIMMRNTTTFWVSGGRLQRSMAVKNPILCLLHLPEPLPRAISPLASSSSSSSAPLPLPRRLSLSAEPPHHTASPRPLPRLAPSASSSAAFLLRSAPAGASSASPATLPMPTVAPACQWRLGAYLCQRVWESALCEAIFCITCWASPPPPLVLLYSLFPLWGAGTSPLFFLFILHQFGLSFPLVPFVFLSVRMSGWKTDDGMLLLFVSCSCLLVFSFLFFLSFCPLFFPAWSSLSVAYMRSLGSPSQTSQPFVLPLTCFLPLLSLRLCPPFLFVKSSC